MLKNLEIYYILDVETIKNNLDFYYSNSIDLSKKDKLFLLRTIGFSNDGPSKIVILDPVNTCNSFIFNDTLLAFCHNLWGGILKIEDDSNFKARVFNVDGWDALLLYKVDQNLIIEKSKKEFIYPYELFKNIFREFCLKVWMDMPFFYKKLEGNGDYQTLKDFYTLSS